MRLIVLNETQAIMTADEKLFLVTLTASSVRVTLKKQFDEELDPILFINKMRFMGKSIVILTTMLGNLIAYDLLAECVLG